MRSAARKPLTARSDSSLGTPERRTSSKSKRIEKMFADLTSFLRKMEPLDPIIFETIELTTRIKDSAIRATESRNAKTYATAIQGVKAAWAPVPDKLSDIVLMVNEADLVELASERFNSLDKTFETVNANPPTTSSALKSHKSAYRYLKMVLQTSKAAFASEDFEAMKRQLQQLKSDISHQYESFFRLSQVDKSMKSTVVDDCRRIIDELLSFGEIWNQIGEIEVPETVTQISDLLQELENPESFSKIGTPRRSPSLIPRPSPMRPPIATAEKKLLYSKEEDEVTITPRKRSGRIPVRAKSVSDSRRSSPARGSMSPRVLDKEPTTPERNSRIASPSGRRSMSELGSGKSMVPLRESPKIHQGTRRDQISKTQTLTRARIRHDSDSSGDEEFISKRPMRVQSPTLNRLANDLAEIDHDQRDGVLLEIKAFEAKLSKYAGSHTVNDLLTQLVSELRSLPKTAKRGMSEKLKQVRSLIHSIEDHMSREKPRSEAEKRLHEARSAITNIMQQIGEYRSDELETIKEKLSQIKLTSVEAEIREIREELTKMDTIIAENRELKQECEKLRKLQDSNAASQRRKVCVEMKAVQCRIAALQTEKKQGGLSETDAEDLEAELEALLEQQMDLIRRMMSLK